MAVITSDEYITRQLEKTDLFRLLKHCIPERYHQF